MRVVQIKGHSGVVLDKSVAAAKKESSLHGQWGRHPIDISVNGTPMQRLAQTITPMLPLHVVKYLTQTTYEKVSYQQQPYTNYVPARPRTHLTACNTTP
jgi:hypothetical protein